ncbi:MAG: AAA family ATPase [Caldithrix sp.]|nr:AAA family ATPase [Caldithrix sp.]
MASSHQALLQELNDQQLSVVNAPRQPLVLIAGPGTGKTRTIIARILYQIQEFKIPPEQILALTFSNKAANEIKLRLKDAIKDDVEKINTGTFHSFCLNALRRYYQTAGLNKHFSVCDDSYQKKLIRELIQPKVRENIERKVNSVRLAFSNFILKDKPLPKFSALIYDGYAAHLQKHNLVDYDQLLKRTLDLLRHNDDILEQIRFMNQSVLVDEFQDTDPVQYAIVRLLAQKHQNIFVVADDDQSIYAWRGANPNNIRQFMEDFNIKKPHFLDKNYRSGDTILKTAFSVVKGTDRVEPNKQLFSFNNMDAKVQAYFFNDEHQELNFIRKKISDWINNHDVPFSEIAVIYPRHQMGERIVSSLIAAEVPHQLAAGRNLLEHPLMKRIILYLQLIRDPSDSLILEELTQKELGYHVHKQIQRHKQLNNVSFRKALNEYTRNPNLNYDLRHQINTFVGLVANLINLKNFYRFRDLIDEITRNSTNLNTSYLASQTNKLEITDFKKIIKKHYPQKIWLYHSDEHIVYIAGRLIKKALGINSYLLTKDKRYNASKSDLVILLEPFELDETVVSFIPLFKYTTDRRKGIVSTLFRWLQVQLFSKQESAFNNYVVFDLETTGKNPDNCGIVEIAAIKIEAGQITDSYQTLINPQMPIEKEAQNVHHISPQDVKDAPSIENEWPNFRRFIGDHLLIAHNGYAFDFKIIDRINHGIGNPKINNIRYDSLILARRLFPGQQNSIDGLADRFKLQTGNRHRALDDVKVLHQIFQHLLSEVQLKQVKSSAEELTEFVALANIQDNTLTATEDQILLKAGIPKLLSPYSHIFNDYTKHFNLNEDKKRSDTLKLAQRILPSGHTYGTNDYFLKQLFETAKNFDEMFIDDAIAGFLSYLSLINPQDALGGIDAVSLLTYHAAKGLEFERVIIVGLEDEHMPSFFAYKKDDSEDDRSVTLKIEEQKRLLYVGITRAKREVAFTLVKNRDGRRRKSSPFLSDIKEYVHIISDI